eukprot:373024-Pleurochrysis_carterae.AAC.1
MRTSPRSLSATKPVAHATIFGPLSASALSQTGTCKSRLSLGRLRACGANGRVHSSVEAAGSHASDNESSASHEQIDEHDKKRARRQSKRRARTKGGRRARLIKQATARLISEGQRFA